MIVFVGMETSGQTRRAFQAKGHETYSCDLLPAQDGGEGHIIGDIFEVLDWLWLENRWPDIGIFHPDCTYLTSSAEWAYKDGPYHQKVKPETLVGAPRREAREQAIDLVRKIWHLPKMRKCIENPIGALSRSFMKPTQVIQPHQFGADASKATCLWLDGLPPLRPTQYVSPTKRANGEMRWANQTDTGQNRLSPGADRWQKRADTYSGVSAAMADQWG